MAVSWWLDALLAFIDVLQKSVWNVLP